MVYADALAMLPDSSPMHSAPVLTPRNFGRTGSRSEGRFKASHDNLNLDFWEMGGEGAGSDRSAAEGDGDEGVGEVEAGGGS